MQSLVLKNASLDTIEVNYKLPETSFFSMPFPEYKRLSPGMFTKVNVVFRPVHMEPYDDVIEFLVRNQSQVRSFYIRVASELSTTKAELPRCLDFGFCAVNELSERHVPLKNTGQTLVNFEWNVGPPFNITPRKGSLEPGKTLQCVASVVPKAAEVVVTSIACKIEGIEALPFKMSCIGKYTFLSLSEARVNFGTRPPGKAGRVEKELWLRNHATVPASFRISREPSQLTPVFSVEAEADVVPANESIKVIVRYTPFSPKSFTCTYFSISTPGGNTLRLQCVGGCDAAQLSLTTSGDKGSHAFLEFGECEVFENNPDKQAKVTHTVKALTLRNTGSCPLFFSFHAPADEAFKFLDKAYGQIGAEAEKSLRVQFHPRRVGNFYSKLFCLVNDSVPACVEFLGTGYNPEDKQGNRPFPFTYKHVLVQQQRISRGIAHCSADKLARLNPGQSDSFTDLCVEPAAPNNNTARSGCFTVNDLQTLAAFFHMPDKYTPAATLAQRMPVVSSVENIDFGCCGAGETAVQREFHVQNNTEAKVSCVWSVSRSREVPPGVFEVVPQATDISPNRTQRFTVIFRAPAANCFFHAELKAQVYHKCNRSFKLVKEHTFVPPWALHLSLDANTFPNGAACFIPKASFKAHSTGHAPKSRLNLQNIEFPPCYIGDVVYQSIRIENTGNTPIRFTWLHPQKQKQEKSPGQASCFEVRPSNGFLQVGQFQIIMLRFSSSERDPRAFDHILTCRLNENPTYDHVLHLRAVTCRPALAIYDAHEPDVLCSSMHIQPTSMGATAIRRLLLRNTSHVPVVFSWSLPKRLRGIVRVAPAKALLRGNEVAQLSWEFCPLEAKVYEVEASCRALSGDLEEETDKMVFRVVGEGTAPALSFASCKVELCPTLVKQPAEGFLRVINTSSSLIRFGISVVSAKRTEEDGHGTSEAPVTALKCEQREGAVHGRSSTRIPLTFTPVHPGMHEFNVCCKVLDGSELGPDGKADPEPGDVTSQSISCVVTAEATFPRLRIEDARCVDVSTQELWTQLNVARVNRCLSTTVKDVEVPMRFSPKPQGSRHQTVLLLLRNNGNLPASFKLRFPNDMDVELEPWADEKEPSEEDVKMNFILDAGLFEVEPKQGLIEPGDALTVRITYHYISTNFGGRHCIPVHLNLENGAHIRLIFVGKTLTNQERLAFIPTDEYELDPMPIGLKQPPEQSIEIKNPCDEDIQYHVDDSAMAELRRANYDFPVLTCLNKDGVVAARSTLSLRWVFQPIEAKEFSAAVRVLFKASAAESKEAVPEDDIAMQTNHALGNAAETEYEQTFRLVGKGFHPNNASAFYDAYSRTVNIASPPFFQRLQVPNQLASFSIEKLDFGDVTIGSVTRRFTVLHNHLAVPIEFSWDVQQALVTKGTLIVEPMHGVIQPGKFATSRFTLRVGEEVAFQVIHSRVECLVSMASTGRSSEETLKAKLGRTVTRASTFSRRDETKSPTKKSDQSSVVGKMTVARSERMKSTKKSAKLATDTRLETASRARTAYSVFSSISTKPYSAKTKPSSTKRTSELLYVHLDARIVDPEDFPNATRAIQQENGADTKEDTAESSPPLFLELAKGSSIEPFPEAKTDNRSSWVMLPECRANVEQVVDNTVYNILVEALHKEISLGSAKRIFGLYKSPENERSVSATVEAVATE